VAKAAAARRRRRDEWAIDAVRLWEQWRSIPLFLFGVALYWGEGDKACRGNQRRLAVSNSDPGLLRTWARWCSQFLPGVPLRYDLNLHDGGDLQAARHFWKRELGVDLSSVTVAVSSASKRRRNCLPHGTLKIRVGAGSCEWHTKMMVWLRLAEWV
jgi:hypothetical protein